MPARPLVAATLLALIFLLSCATERDHEGAPDLSSADTWRDASADANTDLATRDAEVAADTQDVDDAPEPGFCAPNPQDFPVRPALTAPATLPFLHVEGTDVVTPEGATVALRGVNFGSWLMMETWIAGLGPLGEGALLDALAEEAQALGVGALLEDARDATALEWLFETVSHYALVLRWREAMKDQASAAEAPAVDALWAWFDEQPWIFEEESLWEWLSGRFGHRRMEQLRLAFQRSYITALDVERVADLGLNLIRVPIWYQSLETDYAEGNGFRPEGWELLHELGLWAREHEVYLMIDLHGAPGGQSTSWHQGLADGGHLWARQDCIDKTTRLWRALASFFADDPHVAVYDLLNEPMNFPDAAAYREVHDALYQAIREHDPAHIVMIEDAYRPMDELTSPAEMGWDNAMFSIHLYPGGASAEDYLGKIERGVLDLAADYDRFACPLFLGEFNAADGTNSGSWAADAMDQVLAMLNARGVHWAPWTFKYYRSDSIWGLYSPMENAGEKIDLKDGSFEEILAAFQGLHSERFAADAAYEQATRRNALTPPAPLKLD